jgi:hypothetical protein
MKKGAGPQHNGTWPDLFAIGDQLAVAVLFILSLGFSFGVSGS